AAGRVTRLRFGGRLIGAGELLRRALPPGDRPLARARHGQLVRRRVLRDRRARTNRRTRTDLDGRDQSRVGADERAVADHGAMLVRAVVVARDRARADVDAAAEGRVADVAQVIHLGAGRSPAVLHLDEVADLHLRVELRARPDAGEGTDLAARARPDAVEHGMRVHDGAGTESRVRDHA